jgi:hypothetical protein
MNRDFAIGLFVAVVLAAPTVPVFSNPPISLSKTFRLANAHSISRPTEAGAASRPAKRHCRTKAYRTRDVT